MRGGHRRTYPGMWNSTGTRAAHYPHRITRRPRRIARGHRTMCSRAQDRQQIRDCQWDRCQWPALFHLHRLLRLTPVSQGHQRTVFRVRLASQWALSSTGNKPTPEQFWNTLSKGSGSPPLHSGPSDSEDRFPSPPGGSVNPNTLSSTGGPPPPPSPEHNPVTHPPPSSEQSLADEF